MRLGVIGTSSISHKFIEAAHITKKLKLHSVYSRSFNKGMDFCADYNCNQVYTDIKDLAKSGIDIVYIASPNRLHFEQALFFLSYGLHVICEKPMALNHRDCLKLHEISQKNGVYIFEAYRHINGVAFLTIKNEIKKLGRIRMASLKYCQYSSRYDTLKKGIVYPVFDPLLAGGSLNDLGVYPISFAISLFGEPNEITYQRISFDNGVDISGSMSFNYDDFLCSINFSKVCKSNNLNEIMGEEGTVVIEGYGDPGSIITSLRNVEHDSIYKHESANDMIYEIETFINCIEQNDMSKYNELKNISALTAKIIGQNLYKF